MLATIDGAQPRKTTDSNLRLGCIARGALPSNRMGHRGYGPTTGPAKDAAFARLAGKLVHSSDYHSNKSLFLSIILVDNTNTNMSIAMKPIILIA